MNIAGLRVRIIIQQNSTKIDAIGNRTSEWTDFFSCWATASTGGGSEAEEAGHTVEGDILDFTVRWSSEIAAVNSKEYRILLGDRIYNITGVDDMGFRHNSRKFHTSLVER